jgi:hypothetical protein
VSESLRPELRAAIRPLATGWRRYFRRGKHHKSTRGGHLDTSTMLFYGAYQH